MDKVITVCLLVGVQVAAMAYWYYKGYSDGLADAKRIMDECFKGRSKR